MESFLSGRPLTYTVEEMEKLRLLTTPLLKDLARVKQVRTRYWIQKHLHRNREAACPGIVLNVLKSKYRILLTDYLVIGDMKREKDRRFSEGQKLMVTVQKSDPWNDVLLLKCEGI